MFSTEKNDIVNPLEILGIPQNFWTLRKALLILFPLYRQMLIMQISTQIGNYMYRKSDAPKKSVIVKKLGLTFRNPKLNTLFCKITFIKRQPFGIKR